MSTSQRWALLSWERDAGPVRLLNQWVAQTIPLSPAQTSQPCLVQENPGKFPRHVLGRGWRIRQRRPLGCVPPVLENLARPVMQFSGPLSTHPSCPSLLSPDFLTSAQMKAGWKAPGASTFRNGLLVDFKGPDLTARLQPARPLTLRPCHSQSAPHQLVRGFSTFSPTVRLQSHLPVSCKEAECVMTTAFTELPRITDPDALKSFLAVMFAVAHPLTNEKTWSLAEREGENVSPFLACTNILFYKMEKKWCGIRV